MFIYYFCAQTSSKVKLTSYWVNIFFCTVHLFRIPTTISTTEILIIVDDDVEDSSKLFDVQMYANAKVNIAARNGLWTLSESYLRPRLFRSVSRQKLLVVIILISWNSIFFSFFFTWKMLNSVLLQIHRDATQTRNRRSSRPRTAGRSVLQPAVLLPEDDCQSDCQRECGRIFHTRKW